MRDVASHASPDGWAGKVAFHGGPENGFAYVPYEVVVAGRRGLEVARRFYDDRVSNWDQVFENRDAEGPGQFFLLRLAEELDPISVVRDLRLEGVTAQPNHVLFAHPVYGSPVYGSPVYGSPVYGSPVYGSPVYGSPVYGSPVYGSPVYGSESQQTGWRQSTARPAFPPAAPARTAPPGAVKPRVVILDTGLAIDELRPNSLDLVEHPAPVDEWGDSPDPDDDDSLDPAAGHGTFIAGLIELLTPGCEIFVERVLSSYGDGDEVAIAQRIDALPDVDLLNLSFGGYAMEHMDVLAASVRRAQQRGTVVVASAGNDATTRPSYPSGFDDVISVAALGPTGPAPFSNHGPWVRACAPGVDLVSDFFTEVPGDDDEDGYNDTDFDFDGWACWSGTSFAAPVVVAALAREIQCYGLSGQEAVERVIDAPGLWRLPDFGTVVNLL